MVIRWMVLFAGISVPLMILGVLVIHDTIVQYIVGAAIGLSAATIANRDQNRRERLAHITTTTAEEQQ